MRLYKTILSFLFLSFSISGYSQTADLKQKIETYLKDKKATVGVAYYHFEKDKTVTVNNELRYPMQSVYKFHLALYVLSLVDKGLLSLDQKIKIEKADLDPDTWSPIRDKYPDGNVELSLSEVIGYTVSQSDNIGCDILFKLVGGTKKVHKYIRSLGIKDVAIRATEKQMHAMNKAQFTNYSKPYAALELLKKFYKGNILSAKSYDFLWNTMLATTTGPRKIKGLLPEGTPVAHKTGASGTNDKGVTAASNDIGIVTLPDGNHFAIVVFVSNSTETDDANQEIIATISKMCFDN